MMTADTNSPVDAVRAAFGDHRPHTPEQIREAAEVISLAWRYLHRGAAYSDHPELLFTGTLICDLGSSLAESTDTAGHTIDHLARLARQIGDRPELSHHDDGDAQECTDLAADHLQRAATAQRDAAKSIDDATSSLRCVTAPRALGFVPEMADEIDVVEHLLAGTWYLPLRGPRVRDSGQRPRRGHRRRSRSPLRL